MEHQLELADWVSGELFVSFSFSNKRSMFGGWLECWRLLLADMATPPITSNHSLAGEKITTTFLI